jgi:hypothetical protein
MERKSHSYARVAEAILDGKIGPTEKSALGKSLGCELMLRYDGLKHEFNMRVAAQAGPDKDFPFDQTGSDSLTPAEVRRLVNKMLKVWGLTEVMLS